MVMPATTTAPSTPSASSLMIIAPPAESPIPTKPTTLPSDGETIPSTAKNLNGQDLSTKLLVELQLVHTPASCGVADPTKSSTHVENKSAQRKLFDEQSTHEEDQRTFVQSAHQSSQQLNIDIHMTGHDKNTEEQHSEDP